MHITLVSDVNFSEDINHTYIKLWEFQCYKKISPGIYKYAKVTNKQTLEDYRNDEWVIIRPKN